jgi:hypothetical protein
MTELELSLQASWNPAAVDHPGFFERKVSPRVASAACLILRKSIPRAVMGGVVSLPFDAYACTLCRSPLAAEVRLWVMDRFAPDLMAVLTCMPFLLAIIMLAGHEADPVLPQERSL